MKNLVYLAKADERRPSFHVSFSSPNTALQTHCVGLTDFLIYGFFDFSLSHRNGFTPLVRPPRLGGNQKVGVFASRSPFRPNNLGLSSVKLVKISDSPDGQILLVSGADLLSGTPIYDIKPYLPFTDCHVDAVGGFADDKLSHSLSVTFDCDVSTIPQDTTMALKECLADDPRPSYQADERVYGMKFAGYNVKFSVKDQLLTVHSLEKF